MRNLAFAVALVVASLVSFQIGKHRGATAIAVTAPSPSTEQARISNNQGPKTQMTSQPGALPTAGEKPVGIPALTAMQRGFAAAKLDIEEALKQIESVNSSDRAGFVSGIFSYAAANLPPAEALKLSQKIADKDRPVALRTMVGEWVYARSPLDEEKRAQKRDQVLASSGGRQGLEVELSGLLASANPDAELAGAWLESFSKHTARSEILAAFAGPYARENTDSFLKRTEGWTPWEKERVSRRFLSNWAFESPQEAWNWYQNERGRFDGDLSSSIFVAWGDLDPAGAQKLLTTLREPDQRNALLNIIGRTMAMKNTDAAVAWADGIADPRERELAHQGIYAGAPRGVGAVLDFKDGFPTLRGIVPGSPLEGTGIKPGDRLLEVRQPDGSKHSLYGNDLQATVDVIRGEPGSQMTLRILRQNGGSGAFEEHLIPVTRAQLYLNEKTIPK
jgi:hypothetical protein